MSLRRIFAASSSSSPSLRASFLSLCRALTAYGARSQQQNNKIINTTFATTTSNRHQEMSEHKPGATPDVLEVPPADTIFAKIAQGTIATSKVYEDEHVLVFNDINPQAPTHLLIIPKKMQVGQVDKCTEADIDQLGRLLLAAGTVAKKLQLGAGYRLVVNQGTDAQQSVNYLHIHLLSGRKFKWPPG